jgi:hypothetical protein
MVAYNWKDYIMELVKNSISELATTCNKDAVSYMLLKPI